MNKSRLLGAVCILLLPLQAISIKPAQAAVLTFEEVVIEQFEGVYLNESGPFSLHHLNPSNVDVGWYIANYSDSYIFSDSLVVSPANAVGLSGDSPYSISLIDGGLFNFQGVYFGAVNSGTSVDVSGYGSNGQIYTDSISIGNSEIPVWFNANWNDVVRIKIERGFVLYGFTTLDNFTYSVVPIPPSVWLFGSGLLGLVGLAKKKTIRRL
jgi:hypothetical protein